MKKLKSLIIVLIIAILVTGGYLFYLSKNQTTDEPVINNNENTENSVVSDSKDKELYELYRSNKAINKDYMGNLYFESDLINLPFVQGYTNDDYLRKDWKTNTYDEEGSIFVDCMNELDDQNLVIYGHYVYPSYDPSRTHKFTPLEKLTAYGNYEANRYIRILLDGKIRRYEIAVVFYCEIEYDEAYQDYVYAALDKEYFRTEFDKEYFETYKKAAYRDAFYDTGVDISYEDKLLTLQTCVENRPDLRLIVVAKLIEERPLIYK